MLCRGLRLSEDLNLPKLAALTPGFVGADLMSLVREAAVHAVSRVLHGLWYRAQDGGSGGASMEQNQCDGQSLHLGQVAYGDVGDINKGDPHPTTSRWMKCVRTVPLVHWLVSRVLVSLCMLNTCG